VYEYCDKIHNGFIAEVQRKHWMAEDQKKAVQWHRVVTTLCLLIVLGVFYGGKIYRWARSLCYGSYVPRGEAKKIGFSAVNSISAFVPQIQDGGFDYPYLCCDISEMDVKHISWNGPFADLNLCSERDLPGTSAKERRGFFSTVSYYPPPDTENGSIIDGEAAGGVRGGAPSASRGGLVGTDPTKAYKEYLRKNRSDVWKKVPSLLEKAQHEEDEFTTVINLLTGKVKGKNVISTMGNSG
jgi:hypothetical protein